MAAAAAAERSRLKKMKKKLRLRAVDRDRAATVRCCNEAVPATLKAHHRSPTSEPIMSQGQTTTDHEKIRKWVKERGGRPSTVTETEEDGHAGILRIDFGPKEEGLEEIEWDEFFRKFDEAELAFLYQDRTADGQLSRFHKFVRR
jgi:hypothetical protein